MDVVVTVPMDLWAEWLAEGDLPGDPWSGYDSHFWFSGPVPAIAPGERVYVVAHGRLRGYAPLVAIEPACRLRPDAHCLLRRDGAVACTLNRPLPGFRGWRYRFWDRTHEQPFANWQGAGVRHGGARRRPVLQ